MNLEASDLSLSAVKDLVCSIVDQKVGTSSYLPFIIVNSLFSVIKDVLHLHRFL